MERILDMILTAMDKKYPNEKEELHMQKIQQFCLAISKMFMPLDDDVSGFYDTEEDRAKENGGFLLVFEYDVNINEDKIPP